MSRSARALSLLAALLLASACAESDPPSSATNNGVFNNSNNGTSGATAGNNGQGSNNGTVDNNGEGCTCTGTIDGVDYDLACGEASGCEESPIGWQIACVAGTADIQGCGGTNNGTNNGTAGTNNGTGTNNAFDACLEACGVGCPAPEHQICGQDGQLYCNACVMACHGVSEGDPALCGQVVDTDQDGVRDDLDAFPGDPAEWEDTDEDGVGNNADDDDDDDGLSDVEEAGFGVDCVRSSPIAVDTDGDEIADPNDPYPYDPWPEFMLRANDTGSIDLFLSNRDGTFGEAVQIGEPIAHNGAPLNYQGFSIGDYDGDGRMDFIAHSSPLVEGESTRNFYYFFRTEKEDEFIQRFIGTTDVYLVGITTDANADFRFDVVTYAWDRPNSYTSGQIRAFVNNGQPEADCVYGATAEEGCFFVAQAPLDVTSAIAGEWVARMARQAVDLNPQTDRFADLTLITYSNGGNAETKIYTMFGNGDGTYQAPVERFRHNSDRSQAPANTVLFADLNNDDVGDVFVGFDDDGAPGDAWAYFGVGDGTFDTTPLLSVDINPTNAVEDGGGESLGREGSGLVFDFDFDGSQDLIVGVHHVRYDAACQTRLYRGVGDGTFDPTFSVIGAETRACGAFAVPQRLCSTFEILGD